MPWNQPGSGGNDNDPWGQRDRKGNGQNQGPPDLDEILRQFKKRIDNMFGSRGGGGNNDDSGTTGGGSGGGSSLIMLIAAIGFGIWILQGIYTVDEGEQAVELRFGAYSETNGAGLQWHWPPPFETAEIVNTQKVNTVEVGYRQGGRTLQNVPREALMLTQDENIIDIQFAVQYDIKNPTDLLFNVSEYNPTTLAEEVVRGATESAVREIVGRSTLDFAITQGRAQIAAETKTLVQDILDRYETGINIRTVEMQNAQPPAQVKDAFDDAVRAREDEVRLKNLAEAYANDIIPRARGESARIVQEAEAYKASVIAKADGETSRFDQVREEYSKAPQITRDRLYIETMENVFTNTSKMIIDQKDGGNNVMYLPLDQLLKDRRQSSSLDSSRSSSGDLSQTDSQFSSNSLRSTERDVDRSSRQ